MTNRFLWILHFKYTFNSHWLAGPAREGRPVTKNFFLSAMDHFNKLLPAEEIIFIVGSGKRFAHEDLHMITAIQTILC